MTEDADFSSILRGLDMTSTELARRLGVSDGHIADLKSGRRNPSVDLAARLELLTGRDDIVAAVVARIRREAEGRVA